MAAFNSSKFFPTGLKDITGIVNDMRDHFAQKGYEVNVEPSSQGCFISLSKGGIFKQVLGMKTSLNVDIRYVQNGLAVDAKVGIFGQQVIPALISWFVAWPVLLTQITGLVQQARLDDEVLTVIEEAIGKAQSGETCASDKEFCVHCGTCLPVGAAFCPSCGQRQG